MKRWTHQSDTLLVAHAMTLDEVAELLGRTEAECLARAEELGVDLVPAAVDIAPAGGIVLQLHPDLVAELTEAAEKAGCDWPAFCRRILRMGFAAYVPDERLPELPDAADLVDQCDRGRQSMPLEAAEAIARRVLVQLFRGSIELARLALEDGWESHTRENEPAPVGDALLDEPLSRFMTDIRTLNSLERHADILTVRQFLEGGDCWTAIPNVGGKTSQTLRNLYYQLQERAGLAKEVA